VELLSLSAEGRIALTLTHGKHTYSELRLETGLSDRWLTVKLNGLMEKGIVEREGKWYGLREGLNASACELSLYMIAQAGRIAQELARLSLVKAIVLFGSVAQKRAQEYSDLDMVVVVGGPAQDARKGVFREVSRLEGRYHITIEPLILSQEDFMDNIQSREGGIVYGIAEGYEVLMDKTGVLAKVLRERVEEIKRSHDYLEERIWLRAR